MRGTPFSAIFISNQFDERKKKMENCLTADVLYLLRHINYSSGKTQPEVDVLRHSLELNEASQINQY